MTHATRAVGVSVGFAFVVALLFGPSLSGAQDSGGQPSAKATAKIGATTFVTAAGTWTTILSNTIKTANKKDLFVGVSLGSALYTSTRVRSKNGETDTETAEAGVEVRVLMDGLPVAPGTVTFAKRSQTLSAKLQGIISGALTQDAAGNIIIDPTLVTDEEIELILSTQSANAFNFVQGDVSPGVHRVEVQVKIDASVSSADSSASALVGPGSFTVEEVRLIRNEDIVLP